MANECDIDSLMTSGRFREAAELASSLIEQGGATAVLHDKLSQCADHLGWFKTANKHAILASKLESTIERRVVCAYTAFMSGAEEDGWARFYDLRTQGIDASPQLVKLAKILFARSLTTQAKLLLVEAIKHSETNFEAYLWLGHCEYIFKNFADAVESYERAKSLRDEASPILESSKSYASVAQFFESKQFLQEINHQVQLIQKAASV